MTKQLHSMRTYFARPGQQPVDTVTFAQGVLANLQRAVREQLGRVGFAAARSVAVLDIVLGDPGQPAVGRAVTAYVSGGAWLAKCECNGAEFVDLELRVFMCCSCWNAADGHAWRPVLVPSDEMRAEIEAVLLVRGEINRGWKAETIAELEAENMLHGLARRAEEVSA